MFTGASKYALSLNNQTGTCMDLLFFACGNQRGKRIALQIADHILKIRKMAGPSSIELTESTWNPVAGCTVLSPGCTNCYAMRLAGRLQGMGQNKYARTTRKTGGRAKWTGHINLHEESLDIPGKWRAGRLIFVNSMSDLFHEDVPLEFILRVFETMRETPQHTYQILTKRAERLEELDSSIDWPSNVWMGVSVENSEFLERIERLKNTRAFIKFLSLEPLLGPLDTLDLRNIHLVIAGGESGPDVRPVERSWIRSIRDQCLDQDVAFRFKQWGGKRKKQTGQKLDGGTWDQMSAHALG